MVSLARALIVSFALLTIASAIAGLWVYNSHISPLKALGGKPALGDILDRIERLEYTMNYTNSMSKTWKVVIENNPATRSGSIKVYDVEGKLLEEYNFNYTKTILLGLSRIEANNNLSFLNPLEYLEALATNIKFDQTPEGNITHVKSFPGIAPIYALEYVGNATYIDWTSFYKPRGSPPRWIDVAFAKVTLPGNQIRGVEIFIRPQQVSFSAPLKWYQVEVHAKLANLNGVPIASELTLITSTPQGETPVVIVKVDNIKLRSG